MGSEMCIRDRCNAGTLTDTAVCNGNSCDASNAPTNGALNDCTSTLAHGSSCTPDCDTGYSLSGTRSCSAGTLTNTACAADSALIDAVENTVVAVFVWIV